MMLGQDMDMKTMVDVMKATGDLYIDVIENVHCVLNAAVSGYAIHSLSSRKW